MGWTTQINEISRPACLMKQLGPEKRIGRKEGIMIRFSLSLGGFLVLTVGCSSMKVNTDFDRQADFSSYKTYAWRDSATSLKDKDPLGHERIVKAVDGELQTHGFQIASQDPDIVVTYHSSSDQQTTLNTDYMGGGWGFGPGWRWGGGLGMTSSTTTVQHYDVGTVVLDMWDAKLKRLVWRGTASDTVSDDPRKNAQKITQAARKLFEGYPPAK